MNFYELVLSKKEEILERTKQLLRIPSVLEKFDPNSETPFGKNINDALTYMINLAQEDEFITKNINNYAAHIEYGSGKEILGILCHLDVVPVGDGWTNPPFSPVIKEGKLYARGSGDDKGPTMAAYFALKLLKEMDFKSDKRIRIILGTDEETAWRGIDEYFKTEQMPDIGFAPDASFPLIYGEKGIYSFDVTGKTTDTDLVTFKAGDRYNVVPDYAECTLRVDLKEEFRKYLSFNGLKGEIKDGKYIVHGKRAHAMQPNLGINAAFILAQFLNEHIDNDFIKYINEFLSFDHLGEKLNVDHFDDEMKDFTMNPAVFEYIKQEFKIGINCRYPKGWDKESAKINLDASVRKYKFKFKILDDMPIHYVSKDDELVQTLHQAYIKYTGDNESELITIGGGTYSRSLKKAVAFGPNMPGRKDTAHQIDEYIFVEDLLKATAIYMEAIYQLCKK
ncbi:Putative dipeptidase [Candidatus Izimaplasma bacterium HR1]|uniref:dipeptidase PepV n=1 Tax=Candidatus Izimoplasma sp. HR1 TaxID=1541959 RepID=UPI0004F701F3|nr:Putative dipeptidase [Candidatus Izimaplasma bacterium HR1]